MKQVILDGTGLTTSAQVHELLARELDFPIWYGANLDALYDCLTDVKEAAYCLKRLMGYVRNLGDGPDFNKWQREVTYSENDAKVVLITNMENHMTDWELYLAGKNMQG